MPKSSVVLERSRCNHVLFTTVIRMSAVCCQRFAARVRGRTLGRLIAMVAAALTALVVFAGPAAAHVELSSSDPVNVSRVSGPIKAIRLTFSAAADAVPEDFELRGPSDTEIEITAIENESDTVLVVTPAVTLENGRNRLTWAIRSGDSHTMTGTIAFTITGEDLAAGGVPGAVTESLAGSDSVIDAAEPAESGGSGSSKGPADHLATASRWLVYAGIFLCVGGLAYLAWVHRGTAAEGRRLVFYVRRAALVVIAGAIVEWFAQVAVFAGGDLSGVRDAGAWLDLAGSGFGKGTALRLLGAGLVLAFVRIDIDHPFRFNDLEDLGFDGLLQPGTGGVATIEVAPLARLRVEASPMALLGAAGLVVSEAFIGHTATVSPRFLVLVSDAGHLVAAAAWSGGVLMLAMTLRRRHRRKDPLDARLLATRFSVMATWAIAVVAATGLALSWAILGEVGALWATEFGRVLVAKLVVVGVLLAIGAHNHRVLVPAMTDGDRSADERFRRTVGVEALLFGVVLLLSAVLVVSNPS